MQAFVSSRNTHHGAGVGLPVRAPSMSRGRLAGERQTPPWCQNIGIGILMQLCHLSE